MGLKFYNTLTRKIEPFKEVVKGKVSFYSCGPTVYDYVHIGNFRAFLFYDLLKRYLIYRGYQVKHVMNITDVDDKTIKRAKEEGKSLSEVTKYFTDAFLEDLKDLRVLPCDIMPLATAEVSEMVEMIEELLQKGYAYKTPKGDVYFKISSFDRYGELANIDLNALKVNAEGRLNVADNYDKENAADFALWKAYTPEDGDVYWDAPFGRGRPGWHIECSAMAVKYLGQPFDIHAGGVDLVFPHHTNEIAQAECARGKKFANYWLHNAHLIVNGKKMSKSLGNFYTYRDLKSRGIKARALRFALLRVHYRSQLDFKIVLLSSLNKELEGFDDFWERVSELEPKKAETNLYVEKLNPIVLKFQEAMDNDLNVAEGLSFIYEFLKEVNKNLGSIGSSDLEKIKDAYKGFNLVFAFLIEEEKEQLTEEQQLLIKEREEARKHRDFKKADKIRDALLKEGIVLKDTPNGTKWWRK